MLVFPKNAEKNASTIEKGLGITRTFSCRNGVSIEHTSSANYNLVAFN